MAKHVSSELELRMSAKFPTKFVKRLHNDDKGTRKSTECHSVSSDAAGLKRRRNVAAVTVVPQPPEPCANNSYVVSRSEMMAFFSLLGTFKITLSFRSK